MKIVFATNNKNKIEEIQKMLPSNIELIGLDVIGCMEDIPETADSIEGNAIQKANYVTEKYGYDCFSDDTGLEIEVLHNEPGVYSARYAGEQRNANDNMDLVLEKMKCETNRTARFKTVICLNFNNKQHLFEGIANGTIATEKSGQNGFGYDPIFFPDGFDKTFAEISSAEKNKISHRAKATQLLIEFFK